MGTDRTLFNSDEVGCLLSGNDEDGKRVRYASILCVAQSCQCITESLSALVAAGSSTEESTSHVVPRFCLELTVSSMSTPTRDLEQRCNQAAANRVEFVPCAAACAVSARARFCGHEENVNHMAWVSKTQLSFFMCKRRNQTTWMDHIKLYLRFRH